MSDAAASSPASPHAPDPLSALVRPELAQLRAYAAPSGAPPIKLDANESPWPLPAALRSRIAAELADIALHRYPDPRAEGVRAQLAAKLGARPEQLVLGSGSDEVIALLCTALARPREGRTRAVVLHPTPSFVMYRITALAHGLEPVEVPLLPDFSLDVPAMQAAIAAHRPSLVFLATPNNPTGNAFTDDAIRAVIESAPESLVVIDEAYAAFAGRSLSAWCDAYPNVALLGTLSKIGLAAIRLGWVRLPTALAAEVEKARQPFNLNALSQTVAALALGPLAPELDAHVAAIVAERTRLGRALAELPGVHVAPSDANFFLLRFDADPGPLVARLAAEGIAVRYFAGHGAALDRCVRVTVGTPAENDALLAALTR
jgi:histidinol-phosphate aminotransferase